MQRFWLLALVLACGWTAHAQQIPQSSPEPGQGHVYRIEELPLYPVPLAPGEGVEKVQQYCSICHSTTYITGQPPLPGKAWAAEVKKMIAAYGAPIQPSDAEQIVAYLQTHYTPDTIQKAPPLVSHAGADLYASRCAACHGAELKGVPGLFPPLAQRLPKLAATPAGRRYLAHVVLFGLRGPIEVQGEQYKQIMPAWGTTLSDTDIADVLSFVTEHPFASSTVAALRRNALTADQVRTERDTVVH